MMQVNNKQIEPEQLTHVMMELLKEYGDDVYKIVEEEAKDIARKATSELRQKSPGKYARMWRHSAEKNRKTLYRETVFNKNYQLTHLLEKPHKTGKSTSDTYPKHRGGEHDHTGIIAEVEEKYSKEFMDRLERKL